MNKDTMKFPKAQEMGQSGQSRWKNAVVSIILLSVSLSVSAVAAELVLRLLGHHGAPQYAISNIYPVDDPILDWRYVPNSKLKLGKVVYTYNNSGFHDVGHGVEKPMGITRIIVVGDSVSEGGGVEWKSIFSQVIQSQLGDKFEVINIVAGGLNTPQEIHLFEQEGLRFKPDLVILNFVLNDCDFYSSFKESQRYYAEKDSRIGILNLPINPRLKRLLKSSAFIYFVRTRVEELKVRLFGTEEADYFANIWGKEENRRKITSAFDKFAALKRKNQFDVLVVIWPLITDYVHYGFQSVHEWVQDESEKRGFSTIDLLPHFSRMVYRDLELSAGDSIHPNALGHKVAAEAFVEWFWSEYMQSDGLGRKRSVTARTTTLE